MRALEIAKFSIPTEKRMAFAFGFFELSVAPLGRKDMFDVIEQEIGKSTSTLGPPKLLPNSDYPVAMIFERDYRPSESLNKATLMFVRFILCGRRISHERGILAHCTSDRGSACTAKE